MAAMSHKVCFSVEPGVDAVEVAGIYAKLGYKVSNPENKVMNGIGRFFLETVCDEMEWESTLETLAENEVCYGLIQLY